MGEFMYELRSDGSFGPIEDYRSLDFIVDPHDVRGLPSTGEIDDWRLNAHNQSCVGVSFRSSHDGRGFSFAKRLRQAGFTGKIVAQGGLIPDQARHAFQSGFDAIWLTKEQIDHHTKEAWQDALSKSVSVPYHLSLAKSIWEERLKAQRTRR